MAAAVDEWLERLHRALVAWDGVVAAPHRFGGTEYTVGNVEIGHVHRNGMVDIPFTVAIRRQLVEDGHADTHHLLPDSGWMTFYVRRASDVDHARWLFRLSYLHKSLNRSRRDPERRASLLVAVDALHLSGPLRAIVLPRG